MWDTDTETTLPRNIPGYFWEPKWRFRNDLPYEYGLRGFVFHVAAENQRRFDVVKFHFMLDIIIVWHQLIWRWYR